MVYWLDVKKSRSKPSFEEIIKNLMKKKKAQEENQQAFKDEQKRLYREKKERIKQEQLEKQLEAESHLASYVTKE